MVKNLLKTQVIFIDMLNTVAILGLKYELAFLNSIKMYPEPTTISVINFNLLLANIQTIIMYFINTNKNKHINITTNLLVSIPYTSSTKAIPRFNVRKRNRLRESLSANINLKYCTKTLLNYIFIIFLF